MNKVSSYKNPPGTRVLLELSRADGMLRVCENETHRWLDFGTPFTQSLMCKANPGHLELEYAHGMALALAFNPAAKSLLNFGAGCGTFERFFAAHVPSLRIESVETELALIRIAKEYFNLPAQHEIQHGSAQSYLDNSDSLTDIVLCDLHNGEKNPNFMMEPGFYHDLRRCMASGGVLALNLLPTDEDELMEVRVAVQSVFKYQYLLDFKDISNVMLFAFAEQPPRKAQIIRQVSTLETASDISFSSLVNRLRLLPQIQQRNSG